MSLNWLKNLVGVSLQDSDYENIPNPKLELCIHVTARTISVSTVFGSLIGGIVGLVRRQALKPIIIRGALMGSAVGVPLGPLMMFAVISGDKDQNAKVYDRCYRLRFNRSQVHFDRWVYASSIAGAALGGPPGFVIGLSGGIFCSVAEAVLLPKKPAMKIVAHTDTVVPPES